MENIKRNYEQSKDKSECQYWLVMESCSKCLFETLCRLDKQKSLYPNV